MKIKKVSQSAGIIAEIEQNLDSNSEVNAPSVKAVKEALKEVYSTEETFTGKYWKDGKKIYRKVIIANNIPISNTTTIATGITNADTIIECRGIFKNSYTGLTLTYPLVQNSGTMLSCNFLNGDIVFQGNESYNSASDRTHIFILEYTKTTD